MRYTAPRITATYTATSAIKSPKSDVQLEIGQSSFTNSAAYQSDE